MPRPLRQRKRGPPPSSSVSSLPAAPQDWATPPPAHTDLKQSEIETGALPADQVLPGCEFAPLYGRGIYGSGSGAIRPGWPGPVAMTLSRVWAPTPIPQARWLPLHQDQTLLSCDCMGRARRGIMGQSHGTFRPSRQAPGPGLGGGKGAWWQEDEKDSSLGGGGGESWRCRGASPEGPALEPGGLGASPQLCLRVPAPVWACFLPVNWQYTHTHHLGTCEKGDERAKHGAWCLLVTGVRGGGYYDYCHHCCPSLRRWVVSAPGGLFFEVHLEKKEVQRARAR